MKAQAGLLCLLALTACVAISAMSPTSEEVYGESYDESYVPEEENGGDYDSFSPPETDDARQLMRERQREVEMSADVPALPDMDQAFDSAQQAGVSARVASHAEMSEFALPARGLQADKTMPANSPDDLSSTNSHVSAAPTLAAPSVLQPPSVKQAPRGRDFSAADRAELAEPPRTHRRGRTYIPAERRDQQQEQQFEEEPLDEGIAAPLPSHRAQQGARRPQQQAVRSRASAVPFTMMGHHNNLNNQQQQRAPAKMLHRIETVGSTGPRAPPTVVRMPPALARAAHNAPSKFAPRRPVANRAQQMPSNNQPQHQLHATPQQQQMHHAPQQSQQQQFQQKLAMMQQRQRIQQQQQQRQQAQQQAKRRMPFGGGGAGFNNFNPNNNANPNPNNNVY